jgi:hypothetical protein
MQGEEERISVNNLNKSINLTLNLDPPPLIWPRMGRGSTSTYSSPQPTREVTLELGIPGHCMYTVSKTHWNFNDNHWGNWVKVINHWTFNENRSIDIHWKLSKYSLTNFSMNIQWKFNYCSLKFKWTLGEHSMEVYLDLRRCDCSITRIMKLQGNK